MVFSTLEVAHVARVGNDISKDVKGNLLFHGDGSGAASEVCKIFDIIPLILSFASSGNSEILFALRGLDLDALAANDNVAIVELAGVNARNVKLLLFKLQRGKDTLEDATKEVLELLVIDLGQVGPEDETGLLESGVVEAKSLLAGLHEIHNVRLEGLRANSQSNAAQAVACGASQVHGILAILDHDEVTERLHDILKVGLELLLHRSSNSTQSGGSGGLDTIVVVVKQLNHGANQGRAVLSHDLGVDTITEGIKSTTGASDDADVGLVRRTLGSRLEVLQDSLNDLLVVDKTDQSSMSDLGLRVAEQVDDGRQKRLELGRDKIRSTLSGIAQSQHSGHTVARVLVGGKDGELLQKGHNDLARRELVGQLVNQADGHSSRRHVLFVFRVQINDDVHGLDHELSTEILHGLDLHAAERDGLDEEAKGLRTRVILSIGVASKLNHEHEQVAQVEVEKRRVVGDEGVEDVEDGAVALLVASLDGGLEDVDQAGDESLHDGEGLGVLLGVNEHENGANSTHNVHAHLLAFVVDASLEELQQLIGVVAEVGGIVLEHGIQDERADFAVDDVVAGVEGQQLGQEVLAVALLHVLANDAGNQTRQRVAVGRGRLLQSALQQVGADKRLLILGGLLPELGHQAQGLDRGQLSHSIVCVCKSDLDERQKRLGLGVVVLLEVGRDSLDLFRVG
ncbi:LOW QUALITY PROTEIN: hypothetical protein MKX08_000170 [Trichoderma sp. CBMAI-0020]|nr:LOW QUALITY PROTEIN: hypothetical protein MKX08_000170 [Trichoderma sp. CBMAI-0020]